MRAKDRRVQQERKRDLPSGLVPYRRTPIFDQHTVPAGLQRHHYTKPGVWGVIRVLEGRLLYRTVEPLSEQILDDETAGVILPAQCHEVGILGPVRFFVEFYAEPARAAELQITTAPKRPHEDAEKG